MLEIYGQLAATPLEMWVRLCMGEVLALDDVVYSPQIVPDLVEVVFYGVVEAVEWSQLGQLLLDASEDPQSVWFDKAAPQTRQALVRRLSGSCRQVEPLLRSGTEEAPSFGYERRLTVVDLHYLQERAKAFVVASVMQCLYEGREAQGPDHPQIYLVLDELNKYAPRYGTSVLKDMLLDVAERGRSLGIVLVGAEQTASEIEERVVSNASVRVTGRLEAAEKESLLDNLRLMNKEFGVSTLVTGGMPKLLASEFFVQALRTVVSGPVRVIAYVDYDPAGWVIGTSFASQLARYGLLLQGEVEYLVRAQSFTPAELALYALPCPMGSPEKRKLAERWVATSGGIGGKAMGIHVNHLQPAERVVQALRGLLA